MKLTPPNPWFSLLSAPVFVVVSGGPGYAITYLSLEEAQLAIFPGETFTPAALSLSLEKRAAVKEKTGLSVSEGELQIWRASGGGYFIVDNVIGKHEYITYAVGINKDGSLRQIEIMDYRENYGYQVRRKQWRGQFAGKTSTSLLKLGKDIKNISGATLSCRHITEGVKRLLSFYEIALKE